MAPISAEVRLLAHMQISVNVIHCYSLITSFTPCETSARAPSRSSSAPDTTCGGITLGSCSSSVDIAMSSVRALRASLRHKESPGVKFRSTVLMREDSRSSGPSAERAKRRGGRESLVGPSAASPCALGRDLDYKPNASVPKHVSFCFQSETTDITSSCPCNYGVAA